MHRGDEGGGPGNVPENFTAMLGYLEVHTHERLGRGGSESDDDLRFERFEFGVEPWPAGGDFPCAGLFVESPLSCGLPFEMLDRVGHVHVTAIDSRRDE